MVKQRIQRSSALQFSLDGSKDTNHNGITNLSFIDSQGSYTLRTWQHDGSGLDAESEWQTLRVLLKDLADGDLDRIASVAFDTCSTQLAVFEKMRADPEFAHVISVFCDAHGLQLFVRDVMKLEWASNVQRRAQNIATAINRSKQLRAQFAAHCRARLGKPLALLSAGDTRWSSLINLFTSIERAQAVLWDLNDDERSVFASEVSNTITDIGFWRDLSDLLKLLRVINKHVVSSQSKDHTMDKVVRTWNDLKIDLEQLVNRIQLPVRKVIDGDEVYRRTRRNANQITGWEERRDRQLTDHHFAAHYLDPSIGQFQRPTQPDFQRVLKALDTQSFDPDVQHRLRSQFYEYIRQQGSFAAAEDCWSRDAGNMANFWTNRSVAAPELSKYALRLSQTTANTVVSERSFSCLKLIQTRLRNRLSPDKLNKLLFIKFNMNTLHPPATTRKRKRDTSVVDVDAEDQDEDAVDVLDVYEQVRSAVTFNIEHAEQERQEDLYTRISIDYLLSTD